MPLPRPIFEFQPTHPSCHAATVVELADERLLAAWFAGTHEGHLDVAIWLARFDGVAWSDPVKIADETNAPLWNPVLFRDHADTVWLFYKAGPGVPAWTGLYIKSRDGGQTWSAPTALPAGLVGPAKNKPLLLSNGDILCGTSSETWRAWACWVEISSNGGETWSKHGPIVAPGHPGGHQEDVDEPASAIWDATSHELILPQQHYGVIQPTVWEVAPGHLSMLMCILVSEDNGATWPWRVDLETEPGEYSYPSIIQASDGQVHVVYTHRRTRIRHVMLDLDKEAAIYRWQRGAQSIVS